MTDTKSPLHPCNPALNQVPCDPAIRTTGLKPAPLPAHTL
jgi:hypothetical protein